MSDLRVIQADFANWRPVTGRKVLQLIFEIDISQTGEVLRRLGTPTPGESKWCAIALLENGSSASGNVATSPKTTQRPSSDTAAPDGHHGETLSHTSASTAETGTSETLDHARKRFASLPLTQQAGIRCADVLFREFLKVESESDAADYVRLYCGVASRSELTKFPERWLGLEAKYQYWLTDRKYAQVAR